jgi:hypothetical protein
MIYQIYTEAKNFASNYLAELKATELEFSRKKREDEESKRKHGTIVTKENFLLWRDKFEAESRDEESESVKMKKRDGKNTLTGKEIFLKTLETDKNYEDDAHIIEDIDQEL